MDENSAVWLLLERINKLTERVEQLERNVYNTYQYTQYQQYTPSRRWQIYWQWLSDILTPDELASVANNIRSDLDGMRVMSQEQYDAEWRPDDAITFVTGAYTDLADVPVITTSSSFNWTIQDNG